MSNFTVAVKLLIVFGLLSLLVGQMLGGPSPFDDLQDTLALGVDLPEFNNPFTEQSVRLTAYADTPFRFGGDPFGGANPEDATGCANTTLERSACLAEQDGDNTYLSLFVVETFNARFQFNYSNPGFNTILDAQLRAITVTIQCRTITTNSSALGFYVQATPFQFAPEETYVQKLFCPKGNEYQEVSSRTDFPNGVITPTGRPFVEIVGVPDLQAEILTNRTLDHLGEEPRNQTQNTGDPIARFTYFRIDVDVALGSDCQPPEGAWFPFLDEVACSIANFGALVWRGILFVINGVSFILVSLGLILVFLGQVVFGLLLGVIAMATWFLTIDAPPIVQAIFGVFTVAAIAFPVLTVAQLIRGGGP